MLQMVLRPRKEGSERSIVVSMGIEAGVVVAIHCMVDYELMRDWHSVGVCFFALLVFWITGHSVWCYELAFRVFLQIKEGLSTSTFALELLAFGPGRRDVFLRTNRMRARVATLSVPLVDGPKACRHLIAGMSGTIEDDKLA